MRRRRWNTAARRASQMGLGMALILGALGATAEARPWRGYEVVERPAHLGPAPRQLDGARVFLNRDGGLYRAGVDNSVSNTSFLVSDQTQLSPFAGSDAEWQLVVSCVEEHLAPYNIAITTSDPSPSPHFEAVVAGWAHEFGMSPGVLRVAPFDNTCGVIENAVVYSFAGDHGNDMRELCWTTLHEIAHGLGLDHTFACEDLMSYLPDCEKSFRNMEMPCGEDGVRSCACEGATQNSHEKLLRVLGETDDSGPDPTEPPAPGGECPGGCADDCDDLGAPCHAHADCDSGLCAGAGSDAVCSYSCVVGALGACPVGFSCTPSTDDQGVCWPASDSEELGGCSALGAGTGGAGLLLLAIAALGVCQRRRRLGLGVFVAGLSACSSAPGSEGGSCYPNATCDTGLVCVADTCIEPISVDGQDGGSFAPGADGGPRVDGGGGGGSTCETGERRCLQSTPQLCDGGDWFDEEACEFGCTDGMCREPSDVCESSCGSGHECDGAVCEGDGVCLLGNCLHGSDCSSLEGWCTNAFTIDVGQAACADTSNGVQNRSTGAYCQPPGGPYTNLGELAPEQVWAHFASAGGQRTVTVIPLGDWDVAIYVTGGTCSPNQQCFGEVDNAGPGQAETMSFNVGPGGAYAIFVDGVRDGTVGGGVVSGPYVIMLE